MTLRPFVLPAALSVAFVILLVPQPKLPKTEAGQGFGYIQEAAVLALPLCEKAETVRGGNVCYRFNWQPWIRELLGRVAGTDSPALQKDIGVDAPAESALTFPDSTVSVVFRSCRPHDCPSAEAIFLVDPQRRRLNIIWRNEAGVRYLGPDSTLLRTHEKELRQLLLQPSSQPRESEFTVVQGTVQVRPSQCLSWSFEASVPGRIAGNAYPSGGAGNDIRVLVLAERQFRAWGCGRQPRALFNSGKRRAVVLSVPVNEPGRYYVVFDNSFSLVSAKYVEADIRFVHGARDVGRAEGSKRQATERERRIGGILGRLVEALQAMEKGWGTRQVAPPVYFAVDGDDGTLNAGALPSKKWIVLTRGTIEFAEYLPAAEGDAVLASVLGHELAHIFYRHAWGDPSGQAAEAVIAGGGAALMLHPLAGVIAGAIALDRHRKYDRMQEREADGLGVRLACAAGFDPAGLLTFMARLREEHPGQVSFLQTHPSPAQRTEYLEKEVSNCRR